MYMVRGLNEKIDKTLSEIARVLKAGLFLHLH